VNTKKNIFIQKEKKERWRASKGAIEDLIVVMEDDAPTFLEFEEAKEKIKRRKEEELFSLPIRPIPLTHQDLEAIVTLNEYRSEAPKRRKVDFDEKAKQLIVGKSTSTKKRGRVTEIQNEMGDYSPNNTLLLNTTEKLEISSKFIKID